MSAASAFQYPAMMHAWRHGPQGYANYKSYHEWLRDEFSFRCVFCLRREQWEISLGTFHLDHFVPQSVGPSKNLEYENLLYVCAACNLTKSDLAVPDPCAVAFADCLRVHPDGTIEAINPDGELLIELLRLDDPGYVRYRRMLLETLSVLEQRKRQLFVEWMRFPDDLPELSRPRPPGGNSRPAGINESWFAKRARGEMPETY